MPRPFFVTLHELLDQEGAVTLGALVDSAEEQTYGLLVLLLALPSLVPGVNVVGAPVGGLAIAGLGLQMMRGVERPWLPARLRRTELHKGRVKEALATFERLLGKLRLEAIERRALSRRWMGLSVAWTAILLALPVPLFFGNMAPALVLCLQGAALLEERPSLGWLAALGSLGITVYFGLSFKLILKESLRVARWLAGRSS